MLTRRLETFADGVFAIAATLLILNVHPPPSPLSEGLRHIWPSYAAYAISFLTIGIMWVNHHMILDQVGRVDRAFLFIHVIFLMLIAFVPFPTQLVAEHLRGSDARTAALTYGITLTITALFYNLLWFYAALGRRLLRLDADPKVVSGITRTYIPGPWIYLAATLTALASASVSVALYGLIAAFYVVESSAFGREPG